jgi:photosystem II stability/assembly factor-like uncharacterized protein
VWFIAVLAGAGFALAQEEAPKPAAEPVYVSAKGPILIPNRCTEVELENYGIHCSEAEPCDTFLDISSAEMNNSVIVLAGNLHNGAATMQSILLVSEDEGATWKEAFRRLPGATLEGIQFIDFNHGWLAGHATISLPRDPFILLTNDGGRNWRKVDLFAESRVGVVENFVFTTARNGWVLVDNKGSGEAGRYELYKTATGGNSWTLSEINDRIPRAATAERPPSAAIRVRGEAKRGVLVVERAEGAKWRKVAEFRLKLEDCIPPLPQP